MDTCWVKAMNQLMVVLIYLALGCAGGLLGSRLRVPGGIMLGAMLAVLLFRFLAAKPWPIPKSYAFLVQVLLGIMVGASYTPEIGRMFGKIILPIVASTLVLVAGGLLVCMVLAKLGVLDIQTAYLSTSPGAMTVLVSLAIESQANPPVVLAFHFFRVVFIIVTAPLVFYFIRIWFPEVIIK
jgi:membrane AbrB-like protein